MGFTLDLSLREQERGDEAIQLEFQMDYRGRLRLPRNDKQGKTALG